MGVGKNKLTLKWDKRRQLGTNKTKFQNNTVYADPGALVQQNDGERPFAKPASNAGVENPDSHVWIVRYTPMRNWHQIRVSAMSGRSILQRPCAKELTSSLSRAAGISSAGSTIVLASTVRTELRVVLFPVSRGPTQDWATPPNTSVLTMASIEPTTIYLPRFSLCHYINTLNIPSIHH